MRCRRRSFALALGLLVTLAAWAAPSTAQTWPQRTVKFIVPLGPGSGVDIGARLLADRLTARWGQPVVVENRPGGDGIVAINAFLSGHDDHTLLCTPTSSFTAHPYLHDNLPYKPADLLLALYHLLAQLSLLTISPGSSGLKQFFLSPDRSSGNYSFMYSA